MSQCRTKTKQKVPNFFRDFQEADSWLGDARKNTFFAPRSSGSLLYPPLWVR